MRRAVRRDGAEKDIVTALEDAGAIVLKRLPVDLIVWYRGEWRLIEVKSPKRNRGKVMQKRQEEQAAFVKAFSVPIVTTPGEALRAVGIVEHRAPQPLTEQLSATTGA